MRFSRISKSTEDLKSAESAGFQLQWLVCRAFQLSPFSSSSGSHRQNEIFIICHRGDARWACHSGVNPCHIKTSAARQGPAPAQSPQRGGVVPAEDARHSWPHSPAPGGHHLFSHSATALPVTKSKPQARGVAHQMGSSSPSGRL